MKKNCPLHSRILRGEQLEDRLVLNGTAVPAKSYNVDPALLEGAILQVGKRKFAKLV